MSRSLPVDPPLEEPPIRALGEISTRDPWLIALSATFLATLLFHLEPTFLPARPGLESSRWLTVGFLALTLGALEHGLHRLRPRREQRFWRRLTGAHALWLMVALLYLVHPSPERPLWANLTADLLYAGFYFFWLSAVELQPHRPMGWRFLAPRALTWPALKILVLGLLLYFAIIPAVIDQPAYGSTLPSMYLFLALDAYLAGRLLQSWRSARSQRWRTLYMLLTATAALFLATDLLETLEWAGVLELEWRGVASLAWYLPYLPTIAAARLRHRRLAAGGELRPTAELGAPPAVQIVTFALAFPLLHLSLRVSGLLEEGSHRAREGFVLVWSLVLGGLALAQYLLAARSTRWLARRSRRHQTVLRRREASLRELTAQLGFEEAARLSQELFFRAFRASPDPMLITALDGGRIRELNDSFERFSGYRRQEALGKTTLELGIWPVPDDRGELVGRLREEGKIRDLEHGLRIRSGELRQIRLSAELFEIGGEPSVISVLRDITEEKRMLARKQELEAQLLRAQRLESIGTLAGGIAHDLNNLLAPILMAVQLLERTTEDERARQVLRTLETNTRRGSAMVRQVLTFARGVEGERRQIHPEDLLQEVERFVRNTFPKGIELRIAADPELPIVLGDATQLHQVLLNLCVNARDAMGEKGVLTVEAEAIGEAPEPTDDGAGPTADGRTVVVRVSDTGSGIDPEHQPRVFDPFFSTKEVGKGTGLGLSTARAIVLSHGGHLTLSSRPGAGTTFEVRLPAAATPTEAAAEPQASPLPSGRGQWILVVDDEASIRHIAQEALETYGYRVVTASDGREAVKRYAEQAADIEAVVLDMVMPQMDGPATVLALAAIDPDVAIVASSGLLGRADLEPHRAIRAFLAKPYSAQQLLESVRQAVADRSIRRSGEEPRQSAP